MRKLYAIGELLIDFTPTEQSDSLCSVEQFTKMLEVPLPMWPLSVQN